MIKVVKKGNKITISGHAGYDEYGKDIVCASVSSIIITTVNGLLELDRESIIYNEGQDILTIEIIKNNDIVNILIKNMINLLKELSVNYPKNINIREEDE